MSFNKSVDRYKDYIIEVPDFPIKGVSFKDISPLLESSHGRVFEEAVTDMGRLVKNPDYWIGVDARGFLFASALSMIYGGGVIMCRKKGKLPPPTINHAYKTEYSSDELSIHPEYVLKGNTIGGGTAVIVDDVLATGGTLQATNSLVNKAGYKVIDNLVLIDLLYLPRVKDFNLEVKSLIQYE